MNLELTRKVAELGHISLRDAALVLVLCRLDEIHDAIRESRVWELKDRVLLASRRTWNDAMAKKKKPEGGPKQPVPVRPGNPKVKKDGTRERPNMPT